MFYRKHCPTNGEKKHDRSSDIRKALVIYATRFIAQMWSTESQKELIW